MLDHVGTRGRDTWATGDHAINAETPLPPFARRLISEIVLKISRSELTPGEKLPSIEEMARIYDVGRSTVREAIRYMESTGLVQSFHGRGTFVINFAQADGGVGFLDEIVDMRRMIELHATRRAVWFRTEDDLRILNHYLVEMERSLSNFQRYIDMDRSFHGTIIGSARNCLLPGIFRNISGIYNGMQTALIHLDANVTTDSIVHHELILRAISDQDEEAAIAVTTEHLDMISRLFHQKPIPGA